MKSKALLRIMAVVVAVALMVAVAACGVTGLDTLRLDDGTAAAPALSFTSDPDTGFYRSAANTLDIAAGGTSQVQFTDGVVQLGGFLALDEGAVQVVTAAGTITPVASFQPITSTAAVTNAVIADGTVAGQIVALSNENAADDITILESGSNLAAGGDIVLDGGQFDLVVLLWDGARWIRWSFGDN